MNEKKKLVSMDGPKDHNTPLERILQRPLRLFISLAAHKEISNPKERTTPLRETLLFIAQNFDVGES